MGVLCSSSSSVRTGGPAADIYMLNSGLSSVIRPFSSWTGGLNEDKAMSRYFQALDKMSDNFGLLGNSLGFG